MKIFTDPRLLKSGLIGGTFSRATGPMNNPDNQAKVLAQLGIPSENILRFHQTHSDTLLNISDEASATIFRSQPTQDADGWIFAPAPLGWGAAIVTADCVPLFIWAEDGSAWGLAHCGWRGIVKQLPLKTIQSLQKKTKSPLCVWAGPHIQPCCFEVQDDTACQFPLQTWVRRGKRIFVDLNAALRLQLAETGIPPKNIRLSHNCTCCDTENFFSWRRDHQRNNLLSFIYKP